MYLKAIPEKKGLIEKWSSSKNNAKKHSFDSNLKTSLGFETLLKQNAEGMANERFLYTVLVFEVFGYQNIAEYSRSQVRENRPKLAPPYFIIPQIMQIFQHFGVFFFPLFKGIV
jgi:hypothetical protein